MILMVVAGVAFSGVKLMKIQIVDSSEYNSSNAVITTAVQTIDAARGEIVDVSGNAIVKNKVGYNVVIDGAYFPSDNAAANEIILKTAEIILEAGEHIISTLPVSDTYPYEFLPDSESEIEKLKSDIGVNVYATAENCIDKLIYDYEISDDYTHSQQRIIAGIRYETQLANFSLSNKFVLAEDVSIDTVTKIKERSFELKGIDIVEEALREYAISDVIPHEIGTVGPIYAEEYQELKEEGYALDDTLGKSGIEKAMESVLRGKSGTLQITMQNGEAVSSEVTEEAVPGNTVKLTVDSEFQRNLQTTLESFIESLHSMTKDGETFTDVTSGAIVVLDVNTGAVLGMATAPTYDLNDYIENYSELASQENQPLLNRAVYGLYRPGSTFKTVTATAGLAEGVVTGYTTFDCRTEYNIKGIIMHCTGYHRDISVTRAITVSCNVYFYELGQRLGIDKIKEYANLYGLGLNTGIETGDAAGYIASPETLENLGMNWTVGQVLQAAIGQSETSVTPLQMACQALTIANRGTRYKPYLVDSIYDYNMENLVSKTQPVVAAQIDMSESDYDFIIDGMIGAAENTPIGQYSLNGLDFDVAIKTGTPQRGSGTDSTFIGFAPVDNPQIAFAGIVEGGEYSKYMVRKIIDAYFYPDEFTPCTSEIYPQNNTSDDEEDEVDEVDEVDEDEVSDNESDEDDISDDE